MSAEKPGEAPKIVNLAAERAKREAAANVELAKKLEAERAAFQAHYDDLPLDFTNLISTDEFVLPATPPEGEEGK